jgi:hypothetical protein
VLISEGLATQKSQGDVHVHNFSSRAGRSYRMNRFSFAFAPSPEYAAAHPRPTFSMFPQNRSEGWEEERQAAIASLSPDEVRKWDYQHPRPVFSDDKHCLLKWERELQQAELQWEQALRAYYVTLGDLPPEQPSVEALNARMDEIEKQYEALIATQKQKVDDAEKAKEAAK